MRPLWRLSVLAAFIAAAFTFFAPRPLFEYRVVPILFAAAHVSFLVMFLSPARPRVAGFLYSRGFDRDVIWNHILIVNAVSIAIVWIPTTLIVLTHLRSNLHNAFQSPFYPLMYSREVTIPLRWLLAYLCFTPVAHYIWARGLQPSQDRGPGYVLGAGTVVVAISLAQTPSLAVEPAPALQFFIVVGTLVIAFLALRASRQLHRTLELNS
ncbi:MAG: hypothetical protein ACI8UO_005264 [Verrucomicrobiales bacterium]|jgi:hypothetical protein